ncbi:MAG: DUF4830 domain-containing protein [Clostridia bacterium]|nr:DUF4830 domain-containing protein [Clostridia bacterium]
MFVFSLRANKPKLIAVLCGVVVILVALVLVLRENGKPVVNSESINCKAGNAEERVTFLSQFGWKIDEDPVEVSEVIIPSEFNDTYESYNAVQKNQGMNLEAYKGKRVKRWVYEVKNYPGYAANSECIRATMLVYDGIVIGGDVSSLELNGFMQGFEFPDEALSATTMKTQ